MVVLKVKLKYSPTLTSILRSSFILMELERSVPGWGPIVGPGNLAIEKFITTGRKLPISADTKLQHSSPAPCPSFTKFLIEFYGFMDFIRYSERELQLSLERSYKLQRI